MAILRAFSGLAGTPGECPRHSWRCDSQRSKTDLERWIGTLFPVGEFDEHLIEGPVSAQWMNLAMVTGSPASIA